MNQHPETTAITAGRPSVAPDGALNPPVVLTSTFHAGGEIGYGRYGNQTWSALEEAIGALEGGSTLVFSSGMAAISACLLYTSPSPRDRTRSRMPSSA